MQLIASIHVLMTVNVLTLILNEPHQEKTCLRGLRPGKTLTGLLTTETSYSLEIVTIASIGIILSKERTKKTLIRLRECTG